MAKIQSKNSLIADRYALALVELVKCGKTTYDKVSVDLSVIKSTLNDSKDLDEFLTNPLVSLEDKKEIISRVFGSEVDEYMLNFLKVLVDKSRFSSFMEIVNSFNKELDKINNISRVQVVSAIHLSDSLKDKLKNKLEQKLNKTVECDWEIDEKIIAGLVIKMGDNVIDTSLRYKLEDLSKKIL